MKGKFIVIDGTDGTGKGTQSEILKNNLEEKGYKVILFDFPQYGQKSAGLVEEYLNGKYGSADDVNPKIASIFYTVDRYEASFKIRDYLKNGFIVLSNRYTSANMGHQAGKIKDLNKRDVFLDWLDDLEFNIFKIPRPDLNILLYANPDINQKLVDEKDSKLRKYVGGKKRDIHEEDKNHLQKAFNAFLYVAEKYNWEKIDCLKNGEMRSRKDIAKDVLESVSNIM
ncbi:dTMP kinase [Patescibacteria group bacterium]